MSTPAAALEDEDLLREIFLRLPPLPSTLSRASLVCTRWRRILSDPCFLRRFSRHHPEPPLLGFFRRSLVSYPIFAPTLDPPNRIPTQRFFMPEHLANWELQGCRHGLAVMLSESLCEVFVWDPLNGQQHRVPFPPELRDVKRGSFCLCSATVMSVDDQTAHVHDDCFLSPSFKLVLICTSSDLKTSFACVYESASGVWGNIVSTSTTNMVRKLRPSILIRIRFTACFMGAKSLHLILKGRLFMSSRCRQRSNISTIGPFISSYGQMMIVYLASPSSRN
ncbi:hypothetical protein ZWY2020_031058 [Hordeum vulgare]|nr:hypothetical protein ZWY2020_031058 [Hordeum vulgare]